MDPYMVLFGGAFLSVLFGLLGTAITNRESTPVVNRLSEEELLTYRNQRLVTEGISWCTLGKHDFRPGPKASTNVCEECLSPAPVAGKWEAHFVPAHPVRRLNFGKSVAPLYTWWPELYKEDEFDG